MFRARQCGLVRPLRVVPGGAKTTKELTDFQLMLRAGRTMRPVLGRARAAPGSISGRRCFQEQRIDGVFMVHVLSSPENAGGFF